MSGAGEAVICECGNSSFTNASKVEITTTCPACLGLVVLEPEETT